MSSNTKSVYITKNGTENLVVISIELYELLTDKYVLYKELKKEVDSLDKGEKYSEKEVYEELN